MGSAAAFLVAVAVVVVSVSGQDDAAQALLQFKRSMGPGGGSGGEDPLASWVGGTNHCSWRGVTCSGGAVVSLNLSNFNLGGFADTSSLGDLKSLESLSLDLNNLSGTLSPSLTSLNSLRSLNISHNNLSGPFPSNLSTMESLITLDAYNNNFNGSLPHSLPPLIQHLHLGGSFFSGSIPASYGLSGPSLRYLALSGNALTGQIPRQLFLLANLEYLYLGYYNNYSSPIPREIGQLRKLVRLDLSYCNLTGRIPREIGKLQRLDTLFLQINSLEGEIPAEIGRLAALRSLDISNNRLVGRIPDEFSGLVRLELLNLFRNNLSGEIPTLLGDLPNLQVVSLWENGFTGRIPQQLGTAAALESVDLSVNRLTGEVPPNLCDGRQLRVLILRDNALSGGVPESLGACQALERIRLGDNKLSGSVPMGLFSLPNLTMLELMRNNLDGILEGRHGLVFAAANLTTIDLSENSIRGGVPAGLGNLSGLKKLFLAWNRLSGSIPSEIGNLSQLLHLNLSHNQLQGSIPLAIATSCERLTILDLSANRLSGAIPTQLLQLPVLGVLNLSRNLLSSAIPASLAAAPGLTSLDLSFNLLSGAIPRQRFNATSFAGNPRLCGPPLRACSRAATPPPGLLRRRRQYSPPPPLTWLVAAIFAAALAVLVVGLCCFLHRYKKGGEYQEKRRCWWRRWWPSSSSSSWKLTPFQRLDFSAGEVVEAMVEENVIGRGGSGVVYKVTTKSGETVAAKRMLAVASTKPASTHVDHGFSAEVQTLGKIRHRNIVKLLGCVSNRDANVLVYEYMPNGSLGEAIHGSGTGTKKGVQVHHLDWATRFKVAMQAGHGLCYLHHDCSPLIVHRDVKSNNILLDADMEAHVADFGLAKLFHDTAKSESMSSIAGSYGYIAPEYAYTLKVNEKSDIYSFGVVLLELVTGKRPIEPEFGDGVDIVQWVRQKIQSKDSVAEVVDARINHGDGSLPLHEVMLLLRVALLCTSDLPVDRPTMRDVVQLLSDVRPAAEGKGSNRECGDREKTATESRSGSTSSKSSSEPFVSL